VERLKENLNWKLPMPCLAASTSRIPKAKKYGKKQYNEENTKESTQRTGTPRFRFVKSLYHRLFRDQLPNRNTVGKIDVRGSFSLLALDIGQTNIQQRLT
jgi:hypothetical protein